MFLKWKLLHQLERWIGAWIDLLAALVTVLTLGLVCPWWGMNYRCWVLRKQSNWLKKKHRTIEVP